MDDNELILAAGRGDREAFGVFVQRHQRTVTAFAGRFLGLRDWATAEDLAQEAFMAAWQAAPRYRPQGTPIAWLLQITTRKCLNWRRGQRLRFVEALPGDPAANPGSTVDAALEAEAHIQRVQAALAALPPRQRAAILLRHFHDMTYEEIGEVLEVTDAAVESLLFRARRRLWERLGDKAGDPPQVSGESGA